MLSQNIAKVIIVICTLMTLISPIQQFSSYNFSDILGDNSLTKGNSISRVSPLEIPVFEVGENSFHLNNQKIERPKFTPDTITQDTLDEYNFSLFEDLIEYKGYYNITSHNTSPQAVALNSKYQVGASADLAPVIKIWNSTTGEVIHTNILHQTGVYDVEFSPNGQILAAGENNGSVVLWNWKDNTPIEKLDQDSSVRSVRFSPNGTLLAIGTTAGNVSVWNLDTYTLVYEFNVGSICDINSLEFSSDSSIFVTGSSDFTDEIKVWDVNSHTLVTDLSDHGQTVNSLSISPSDELLVSGSDDNSIIIWNFTDYTLIDTINEQLDVNAVKFINDDKFVTGSDRFRTRVWDVETSALELSVESNFNDPIIDLDVSTNNDFVVLFTANLRNVQILDLNLGRISKYSTDRGQDIQSLVYSPNGELIATSTVQTTSSRITLWNTSDNTYSQSSSMNSRISTLAFSNDGQYLVSGNEIGSTDIRLWNGTDLSFIGLFSDDQHSAEVKSVDFNNDSTIIASGSWDKDVKIWDVEGESLITTLNHNSGINIVKFSPDGRFLGVGTQLNRLLIYNTSNFQLWHNITAHNNEITSIDFHYDSNIVATGSLDSNVTLWNVNDGLKIHTFDTHTEEIVSVNFDPDRNILITVSNYNNFIVWNVSDYTLIRKVEYLSEIIPGSLNFTTADIHPSGTQLATGMENDHLYIWNIATSILGFLNASNLAIINSSFNIVLNPSATVSYAWNQTASVYTNTSIQVPQSFGPYTLHLDTNYLGNSETEIYDVFVVNSLIDYDGDNLPNDWEMVMGLNPFNATDADDDNDGDGLSNLNEYNNSTSPLNPDTDGDGVSDGNEISLGSNANQIDFDVPFITWSSTTQALIDNQVINTTNVTWVLEDTNATNVELYVNGISQGIISVPSEFTWSISLDESISNNITIVAYYDFSYYNRTETYTVSFDDSVPSISLNPSFQENKSYQSGTLIDFDIFNTVETEYEWNGNGFIPTTNSSFSLIDNEGQNTLNLRGRTLAGNRITRPFIFIADNIAPTVVLSGLDNETYTENFQIILNVTELNNISNSKLTIDGNEIAPLTTIETAFGAEYYYNINLDIYGSGQKVIYYEIEDEAGNIVTQTFNNIIFAIPIVTTPTNTPPITTHTPDPDDPGANCNLPYSIDTPLGILCGEQILSWVIGILGSGGIGSFIVRKIYNKFKNSLFDTKQEEEIKARAKLYGLNAEEIALQVEYSLEKVQKILEEEKA